MARAKKLLARMQRSLSGWGQDDLHRLYTSYGFECREGGSHRFYTHPQFPQLTAAVARHNSLAKGYVSDAVKILQLLAQWEDASQVTDDEDAS